LSILQIDTHACRKNSTRKRVEMRRLLVKFLNKFLLRNAHFFRTHAQVLFLHAKCDFYTLECDFHRQKCNVDTLECELYTLGAIFTRKVWFRHARVSFSHSQVGLRHGCDSHACVSIFKYIFAKTRSFFQNTRPSVISTRRV
jgi:hypothetical protein